MTISGSSRPARRPIPLTGGRQLEELAFEVTSEQTIKVPTIKARELARRGVRRVFCVLVKQRRVLERSREIDGWRAMLETEVIENRCLVRPVPWRRCWTRWWPRARPRCSASPERGPPPQAPCHCGR
jgi:hypothetical protein